MFLQILLSFCGGAFGAAVGALPAFIVFGVLVCIGVAITLAGGDAVFLNEVAFGNMFAPHVAFSGGVGAAAYAARKKILKSGKDTITPLLLKKDASPLIAGGVFGITGYLIFVLIDYSASSSAVLQDLDAIAGAVFFTSLLGRHFFSNKGIVSHHPGVFHGDPEDKKTGIWLPWESNWLNIALLGTILGILFGSVAMSLGSPLFGFGLAAASLIFLQLGNHLPVSHHIVLPAGIAAVATGNLFFAAIFGICGALLGELGARLFYNSGDTHIDPPAFSIFMTSGLVCLLNGWF